MNIKEFIAEFAQKTKNLITVYEQYQELTGAEKKNKVDEIITSWVQRALDSCRLNLITKYIIKTFVIKNIPAITQAVFDLIKTRVKGITES